jgi:hypothetical protein
MSVLNFAFSFFPRNCSLNPSGHPHIVLSASAVKQIKQILGNQEVEMSEYHTQYDVFDTWTNLS